LSPAGYKEVCLQGLLIAEVVELFLPFLIGLAFEYLRCDEALQIVPSSLVTLDDHLYRIPHPNCVLQYH